jgi:Adenylate and Guanylate cyclase catalytic domain
LTNRPDIFRGIVLLALFIVVGIFIAFDAYLDRHQNKVLNAAKQSDAIVRSLFPTAVTDRLYEEARKTEADKANEWKGSHFETPKSRVKKFMRHPDGATIGSHDSEEGDQIMTDPIADLFPNTTVLFADLAGFTAWSSEREPAQVFVLLETIYRAMDKAAKRMNIFKVETIGDCYVAATGLPEPQEDHAERMCKFARKSLRSVAVLTKRLEARLGE